MFEFCVLLLSISSLSVYGLDHQWVTWDGVGESPEELPVLHTAFVQTGEELHYFSESTRYETDLFVGHRVHHDQSEKTSCKERKYHVRKLSGEDSMPIEFDPPFLEFGDTAVGIPVQLRVFVRNRLNKPVIMDSIMGENVNFHASFFDVLELGSLGATSFEVAFLPREEGKMTAVFNIHTSAGIFLYELSGRSTSNPYRIVPFVGHRLPFNGTVTREITIHNPHSRTLRIKELISSGGNSHAELAHDVDPLLAKEPLQYWDIRPFQTRTVGKVMITGHTLENITNFVRVSGVLLDDNGTDGDPHDVVLTVPLEVTKRMGVFNTRDILDFGMLRQGERSAHQMFSVYQYQLNGKLEFETLYVDKGDSVGIYMEFASNPPISVLPGKSSQPGPPVDLVKVFFDASRIQFPSKEPAVKLFTGRIIAVSRGGNFNITIPFRASVYQGDLFSVDNDLTIQEDVKPPHRRSVRLRNSLPFGVAVWNVSLAPDARQYFTVRLFDRTTVIPKNEERPVFLLKYNKRVPDMFGSAVVYLHTNVSTYRVQLTKYPGSVQIELFSSNQESFDFGYIERNDTRVMRFAIRNPNRATTTVRGLRVPSPSIHRLYLVAMLPKNVKAISAADEYRKEWPQGIDLEISPEETALFDFELRAPLNESEFSDQESLLIATESNSRVYPILYKIESGSIASIPETLGFGSAHPGKVVYRNLQIFNSFAEDMTVTRLSTLSRDPRFLFEGFDPANPPVLRSGRLTNLGRVMFMPEAPCKHEYCYLGLPLHTPDGQWFVHGLTLPANLAEVDSYLYKKQRARFDALVSAGKHHVNTTVVVDTDKAKNVKIPSSAELVWPRLLTRNSVHFPLTALGNFTIVNLTLSNPTAMPIVVQVIPLVIYPDADAVVEFFRDHLLTPLTSEVEMNETLMFSLRDTELFTLKSDSPVPRLREELEDAVPQTVPRFTLSLLLKPHMKVRLRLGFLPSDYTLRSSLLLIRNNLTIVEPVVVYGRGARIGMQLEGVEARAKQPLLFEIRHDHLTDCDNPKRQLHKLSSTLTVRRPFTVSNNGEVAFSVVNMSINGVPCENRGFRILNCYPFRLAPNETYSLDVAYTPDFLTTVNEADLQLYMHMNGSSWLFPLAATVPPDMLTRCHRALPRPPFENLMYYSCVTALVFCLVCVLACAYLEGDRAIACAIREQYSSPRTVFDLNNLDNTAKSSPRKEAWKETSAPSGLHASADASAVARVFYQAANKAITAVHFVWRLSLFYRNSDEPTSRTNNKKKKKAQVPVTSRVAKDTAKEKAKQESSPVQKKAEASPKSTKTTEKQPVSKKVMSVPKEKLASTLSRSPKSRDNTNQRKKSGATEADRRLARAQNIMDTFDDGKANEKVVVNNSPEKKPVDGSKEPRPTAPSENVSTPPAPSNVPVPTDVSPEKPSISSSSSSGSRVEKKAGSTTASACASASTTTLTTPIDVVGLSTPVSVSVSPSYQFDQYDRYDMSPQSTRPVTPTPSLASSYGFDAAVSLMMPEYAAAMRDAAHSGGLNVFDRKRNPSEGELSLTSELSNPPDWIDESVVIDNADDDFSAMAVATEMMNGIDESDFDDRECETGSVRRLSVTKDQVNVMSGGVIGSGRMREMDRPHDTQPNVMQPTQSLGTWPLPDLSVGSMYGLSGQNLTDPSANHAQPSLAPGTDWLMSSSQWAHQPSSEAGTSSPWNDGEQAFAPLSHGLSLLPSSSSYSQFMGPDFGPWSNSVDTNSAWANIGETDEEKKK